MPNTILPSKEAQGSGTLLRRTRLAADQPDKYLAGAIEEQSELWVCPRPASGLRRATPRTIQASVTEVGVYFWALSGKLGAFCCLKRRGRQLRPLQMPAKLER